VPFATFELSASFLAEVARRHPFQTRRAALCFSNHVSCGQTDEYDLPISDRRLQASEQRDGDVERQFCSPFQLAPTELSSLPGQPYYISLCGSPLVNVAY
jgi:hypothetical protein